MKARCVVPIFLIALVSAPFVIFVIYRVLLIRAYREMLDRPPVGINYVEPEKFEFPDNYGVCMSQGPRIVIRNPKTLKTREIASNLPSRNIAALSQISDASRSCVMINIVV